MNPLWLAIERLHRCSLTQVLELLVMQEGHKPAVRLVIDDHELPLLQDAVEGEGLYLAKARVRLREVLDTESGDIFTESDDSCGSISGAFAVFVSPDPDLARHLAESESDGETSLQLGRLLGLPDCCTASYVLLQTGKNWLEVWGADVSGGPFDAHANHLASFGSGLSPAGEYLPCSPRCRGTADRARRTIAIGRRHGFGELVDRWESWATCSAIVVDHTAFLLSPPGDAWFFRVGEPRPELEQMILSSHKSDLGKTAGIGHRVEFRIFTG